MLRNIFLSSLLLAATLSLSAQESRHFTFHYGFTVKNLPAGKAVRVWIPAAQSDSYQDVKVFSALGDLPLKRTHETKYGNEMYFADTKHMVGSELHFDIQYEVTRRERTALSGSPQVTTVALTRKERQEDLQPNALVPITGVPAELAEKVTQGEMQPLDKARAIYDYVFKTLRYEKTGTGWGRGDVLYACDAKKGNCTDFHSLFIAMARSQRIPARFEIGFPLPADQHAGEIAGYHCWSDFYVAGRGWIPVDISEAWKHPDKHDYFFGSHDVNRIQFSMGRDLRLNPAQDGKPLNYFVYPYVEVDGREHSNVSMALSFSDVSSVARK